MTYPVAYRRSAPRSLPRGYKAALTRQQAVARALSTGNLPRIGSNIFTPRINPASVAGGVLRSLALAAIRQVAPRLHPALAAANLAYNLYWLWAQTQEATTEGFPLGGWTVEEACNAIAFGPYGAALSGCGTKFVDTATFPLGTKNSPPGPTEYVSFLAVPRQIFGTVHVAPLAERWSAPKANNEPVPVFTPAQDPVVMPVPSIPQTMPNAKPDPSLSPKIRRAIEAEIALWPQAREAYEPGIEARSGLYRGSYGRQPHQVPNFRFEREFEVPLGKTELTEVPQGRPIKAPETVNYRPYRGGNEKEIKLRSRSQAIRGVLGLIGGVTEGLDIVQAIFRSLDRKDRRGVKSFTDVTRRVWSAILEDRVDWNRAFYEIFWSQAEDMFFGRLGREQAKSVRRLADQGYWYGPFGTTVGGHVRQDLDKEAGLQSDSPVNLLRRWFEENVYQPEER